MRTPDAFSAHGSRLTALFAFACALTFTSCASLKAVLNFQEPQVDLQEIVITGVSLSGGSLELVFDVFNPNEYRLTSTRVELSLDLEGTHFGDALLERPLDLSPTQHNRVVVPVRFEWGGVAAGARAMLTKQEIAYHISGALLLDTPIGERRVGVGRGGNVPLKKLL
jgi:LEA14-like dessication related protein